MAVVQKILSGNDQPQGGKGIVSIAGARGLAAADILGANNSVSPFPPLQASQLDQSIAVINNNLDERYDDPRYYNGDNSA